MQRPALLASFGLLAALAFAPMASASCPGDLNGDGSVDGADLAVIFGNFGIPGAPGDLNGDGILDGSDIGLFLSLWGPCAPSCTSYQSLNYVGAAVGGPGAYLPLTVLSGNVNVLPSGEPQGLVLAATFDGSVSIIQFALSSVSVFVDTSFVLFPAGGTPELAFIDGFPTTIAEMLTAFQTDLQIGLGPGDWSVAGRAILAMAALAETEPFACNLTVSLEDASPAAVAFWCKAGLASLGGGIVARAIIECPAVGTLCPEGGVASIGEFAMPCWSLSSVCVGDQFVGGQAAFDSVYSLWAGE
ncbi:MAG TPA: hypothetical protein PKC43_13430 [Phycisphaerales bacterium]|nr:hypothetical protein [Phycisphaerales bacterium]HMP38434.1 hypothetical protein [Phycisphaerales bacterium]